MNYEQDVQIDPKMLEVEWLRQASLTYNYAKHLAHCKKQYDLAKEGVDLARALLDRNIRSKPEKYGLEKVTEQVIQVTILQQDKYKDVSNQLIEARYEVGIANAALSAIESKKSALENLVRLHGQQYFAGPSVPRDITKSWEEKQKQLSTNTKIGGAMPEKPVRRRRGDNG